MRIMIVDVDNRSGRLTIKVEIVGFDCNSDKSHNAIMLNKEEVQEIALARSPTSLRL